MTTTRLAVLLAVTLLLAAPARGGPAVVEILDGGAARAVRALGPDVLFFTPRARPLHRLAEIRAPGEEMATGDLGLVRPLLPLLRAGGVKVDGGALDLMRLVSPAHFATVFAEHPRLRLLAVRRRPDGAERAIATRGGGVAVQFRAPGEPPAPIAEPRPLAAAAMAREPVTSFGPLVEVALTATARARSFDPQDGAREETRTARAGRTFLVLHIDRDFGAGEGVVGFLFGSGTLLKPEFERLEVHDGAGRRYPLAAVRAEGRTLELAYDVPASGRGFTLHDGDRRQPLTPRPAAALAP
jgi:hypothetical protein